MTPLDELKKLYKNIILTEEMIKKSIAPRYSLETIFINAGDKKQVDDLLNSFIDEESILTIYENNKIKTNFKENQIKNMITEFRIDIDYIMKMFQNKNQNILFVDRNIGIFSELIGDGYNFLVQVILIIKGISDSYGDIDENELNNNIGNTQSIMTEGLTIEIIKNF